jgi:hypothetical protein
LRRHREADHLDLILAITVAACGIGLLAFWAYEASYERRERLLRQQEKESRWK